MMRLIKSLTSHSYSYFCSNQHLGSSIKLFRNSKKQTNQPINNNKKQTNEPNEKPATTFKEQTPKIPIQLFSSNKKQTNEPNEKPATTFKEQTPKISSNNINSQSSSESSYHSSKFESQSTHFQDKNIAGSSFDNSTKPSERTSVSELQKIYPQRDQTYQKNEHQQKKNQWIQFSKSQHEFIKRGRQKQEKYAQSKYVNYDRQILNSEFHKQGISESKYKQRRLKLLSSDTIDIQLRKQLLNSMKNLVEERQQLMAHNFSQEWFLIEYEKYEKKQQSFISHYLVVYTKLRSLVGKIIRTHFQSNQIKLDIVAGILDIIGCFRLTNFYRSYLIFILSMEYDVLQESDAAIRLYVIDKLYQIKFKSQLSDIQKTIGCFYRQRMQIIFSYYGDRPLSWKVSILQKIEFIFQRSHLTDGKQVFYQKLILNNIQQLQKLIVGKKSPKSQDIGAFIDLFFFSTKSLVLGMKEIQKFNSIMENLSLNPHIQLSDHQIAKIVEIYLMIGNIPLSVYTKWIQQMMYKKANDKNHRTVFLALRTFLSLNCQDKSFLYKIVPIVQSITNEKKLSISERAQIHRLAHYMCIKHPSLQSNLLTAQFFDFCVSKHQKDLITTKKIVESLLKGKSYSQNVFVSPCIQKTVPKRKDDFGTQHQLIKLQELTLGNNLQFILKQMNASSKKIFYELKRNFPFCMFQIDLVVLRWDSPKKEKLMNYLGVEAVGIQYAYDSNTVKNEEEISKKLYQMSMIEYEKGLIFKRNKQMREEILQHYGWKILYVANKYGNIHLIDRKTMRTKLRQAVLAKMEEK